LGLSIAQSFTQICGGKFTIKIDGDLFKVELRFTNV
jgi:microcompartment protein CcmL/EutN